MGIFIFFRFWFYKEVSKSHASHVLYHTTYIIQCSFKYHTKSLIKMQCILCIIQYYAMVSSKRLSFDGYWYTFVFYIFIRCKNVKSSFDCFNKFWFFVSPFTFKPWSIHLIFITISQYCLKINAHAMFTWKNMHEKKSCTELIILQGIN